jgi:hypothetical protein
VDLVHQECWNSPVHTGLSLPVMAWKPRKRRGSVACREKAPKGEALYPPGRQCKSYMVKAGLPEAQFGGVYGAHGGGRRVEKPPRIVTAYAVAMP